jgi:hypothetical protein
MIGKYATPAFLSVVRHAHFTFPIGFWDFRDSATRKDSSKVTLRSSASTLDRPGLSKAQVRPRRPS